MYMIFENLQRATKRLLLTAMAAWLGAATLLAAAPDYYQKKNSWRETITASVLAKEHAPAAGAGPKSATSKVLSPASLMPGDWPFWEQLMRDFPAQKSLIYAAFDWGRQDQLLVDAPAAQFEPKVKALLEQTRKVLALVLAGGGDSRLAGELTAMEAACAKTGGDWRTRYYDVHLLRRKILFAHPALTFDKILFNQNPPTLYSHNGDQHLGRHSRVGPGLSMLEKWKSDAVQATPILEGKLPPGATRNPDLNYDADKVVFAFCDHSQTGEKRYFLYEAAIDGSWIRQLTGTRRDTFQTCDGRATVLIEDNDPCYLPDGSLFFISTRSQSYGRCHGGRYNPAWVLHKCDAKGDGIRQISYGNENEYEPAVLNDGRIIFTRWEYTNRHEMLFHKLWSCRQDGTNVAHYYGNDDLFPMMVTEASAIPGTNKVMATAMGHHSYSTGTTVVIDTNNGENGEKPVTHLTPETPYSETKGWPKPHYSHPFPITEELFLVSRANHQVPNQGKIPPPNDRGIYLVDSQGSRELLYENPGVASVSPIVVRKRQRPPVWAALPPSTVDDTATIFVQNVYLTRNDPEGKIKPGSIKAIRVNALGYQPRAKRTPVSRDCPNEIPKRVLGTVPVNENGSACIRVPARTCLQMQILDENGMAILTEKSFFYLQPGERRGCIGCHEPAGSSPPPSAAAATLQPRRLTPPAGPQYPGGLSFMRTVQPVLDRYCISCHGLGDNKKAVSLIHDGKMTWPRSYVEFVNRGDHHLGEKKYMGDEKNISRPYRFYAQSNKIAQMILKNHGGVSLDRDSRMRIMEFLDLNAQCYGDLFPNKLEERTINPGALAELRTYVKKLFGDKLAGQPERALINTAQPDESRILQAPLALNAGGWGQIPAWKSRDDAAYRRMEQLVEACIVRTPNENRNGWEPTLEQGAGENWIEDEQKAFLQRISRK